MKKDSGHGTSVILETLAGVIVLTLLLGVVFTYGNQLLMHTKISNVARDYLQKMEIEGCLTSEMETQLISELEKLGLTNVDCSNSTLDIQPNGEPVILDVRANMKYSTFIVDNTIKKETSEHNYKIYRTSLSKLYY